MKTSAAIALGIIAIVLAWLWGDEVSSWLRGHTFIVLFIAGLAASTYLAAKIDAADQSATQARQRCDWLERRVRELEDGKRP